MRIPYLSLLALTGLLLASPTWAGSGGDGGHFHDGGMHGPGPDPHGAMLRHLMHAMQQLDLSEEQEDAIHQLLRDGKDDMEANRQASLDNMRDMHELLQADDLDEEALAQVARRSGELAEERVLLAGHSLHAILAELDDAQREQLQAMGEEVRERHRHERWHAEDDA